MKFKKNQVCKIKMMSADATMVKDEEQEAIDVVRDTQDVGTGIVLQHHYNVWAEKEDLDPNRYQIAVIEGRFDPHRNDMGELWVNEFELSI
tara:strand:+ start:32282 stop:32554 length:273 start_codon:yes stop_codon:yes gene_type:complete